MHARYSIPVAVLCRPRRVGLGLRSGDASPWPELHPSLAGTSPRSAARCRVRRPRPCSAWRSPEHLGRHAQAYATVSYFENLMRDTLRDDLDFTATRLATLTGESWSLSGRDRGVALVVGGKYVFGSGTYPALCGRGRRRDQSQAHRVREPHRRRDPGRLQRLRARRCGAVRATDGVNKPLIEFGFGLGIGSGRTHFDIGYRYRNVPRTASSLDFSQVSAGIGYPVLRAGRLPTGLPGVSGRPSRSSRPLRGRQGSEAAPGRRPTAGRQW